MRVDRCFRRAFVFAAFWLVVGLFASGVAAAAPRTTGIGIVGSSPYRKVMLIMHRVVDVEADGDGFGQGCGEFGFRLGIGQAQHSAELPGPAGDLVWSYAMNKYVAVTDPISICKGGQAMLFPYYENSYRQFPDPNLAGTNATSWLLDGPINVDAGDLEVAIVAYEDDPANQLGVIESVNLETIDLSLVGEPQPFTLHVDGYSSGGDPVDFDVELIAHVTVP